jgi:YD repeat-containing protein
MSLLLLHPGTVHAAVQYGVYGAAGLYPDPLSACLAYPIIPTSENYKIDGYMVVNGTLYCSGHGNNYVGHYSNIQVYTTGACDSGKSVDPATGQCAPSHPANSTYDAATATWTCKPGYAGKGGGFSQFYRGNESPTHWVESEGGSTGPTPQIACQRKRPNSGYTFTGAIKQGQKWYCSGFGNNYTGIFSNLPVNPQCPADSNFDPTIDMCVFPQQGTPMPTCAQIVEQPDVHKGGSGCSSTEFGNPINAVTGAKRELVDMGIVLGGLELTLTYDTTGKLPADHADAPSVLLDNSSFGPLWSSSLHRRLLLSPDGRKALLTRGDGKVLIFDGDGTGAFTAAADNPHKLASISAGFRFTDIVSGVIETFDTSGMLRSLAKTDGTQLFFSYQGSNLVRVQAHDGRTIRFVHANGRVSHIVGPEGRIYALAYDGVGNLASITWPDTKVLQLLYESTSFPWALTGKVDESGARYATFSYDSQGRAIVTEHAGGVAAYGVSYGSAPLRVLAESYDAQKNTLFRTLSWQLPSGVAVTQPNGHALGLQATAVAGVPRLASKSQPAGSGCSAAASGLTYDNAGNVLSRDDFTGARTCYAYDSSNRETVRVEGLGNQVSCSAVLPTGATLPASARRVVTTWHPDWAFPVQVTQPLRRSTTIYHGQPDPFNGNATANCTSAPVMPNGKPLPRVCKQVEQALLTSGAVDATVAARTTSFTYDAAGRMLSATNPAGRTTTQAYYAHRAFNGAAYDPHIDAVTLLLHANGPGNSVAIADDSPATRSIGRSGDARISTTQSKFGGSALVFDGAGDYLTIPASPDLDLESEDFTIEMWIYTTQATSNATLLSREWGRSPYTGGFALQLNGNSSGPLSVYWGDHGMSSPFMAATGTSHRNGTWHHVAWTRSGNVHRLFDNGAQVATATSALPITGSGRAVVVGNDPTFGNGARAYNGYIDDLRITRGVARYVANFTPPAQEFPDTAPAAADVGHSPGDLQTRTNPAGHVTSFNGYDPAGRVRQTTDSKGVVSNVSYTLRGAVGTVTATAPNGAARTTTYTYDDVGQLTQVSLSDGTALSYSYDAAHRLVGVTDTRGNTVTYTLDNAGNRAAEEVRDPTGVLTRAVERSFDALNRMQQGRGVPR